MNDDPVALFRSVRQKDSALPISREARKNLRRWLDRKRSEGWSVDDEAEYLAALAEDIKDPDRIQAAEDFWQTNCN